MIVIRTDALDSEPLVKYHLALFPKTFVRVNMMTRHCILLTAIFIFATLGPVAVAGQGYVTLPANVSVGFTLAARQQREFSILLNEDDLCDLSTDATSDLPLTISVIAPSGEYVIKEGDGAEGIVFVAGESGKYRVVFEMGESASGPKQIAATYSNRLELPKTSVSKGVRNVNGYQAKIVDETGDEGKSFFIVQKAGRVKAIMRAEKAMTGGFYFSDDLGQLEGANAKVSAGLMRSTADKTGDGTPDIAIEYYTGGAHCCFEITFFELGERVRQLPTIDTANDRMTAAAKRPGGGLRFQFAEQAFAYWAINFAQSPMPIVIYEFDRSDKLVPRFDLMKRPAPTLAALKRKAAAAKARINLNPYTSPEDNFNDFEEPFWSELLDLIYTGHEELAWQYFDLVWPAKKKGKQQFLADFKEQLSLSTYGDRQKTQPSVERK